MILPSCRCRAHQHAKIWALSFFLTVNKLSIDPVLHLSIYGTPAGYGWPLAFHSATARMHGVGMGMSV